MMNRLVPGFNIEYFSAGRLDKAKAWLDKSRLSNPNPITILKGVPNVRFKYNITERQTGR